jgi:hypothetical protein
VVDHEDAEVVALQELLDDDVAVDGLRRVEGAPQLPWLPTRGLRTTG